MTVRMNGKEGKLRLLERVGCLIQGTQNGACLIRGPKLGDMLVISLVSNHPIQRLFPCNISLFLRCIWSNFENFLACVRPIGLGSFSALYKQETEGIHDPSLMGLHCAALGRPQVSWPSRSSECGRERKRDRVREGGLFEVSTQVSGKQCWRLRCFDRNRQSEFVYDTVQKSQREDLTSQFDYFCLPILHHSTAVRC